jgi:hypothetical protein
MVQSAIFAPRDRVLRFARSAKPRSKRNPTWTARTIWLGRLPQAADQNWKAVKAKAIQKATRPGSPSPKPSGRPFSGEGSRAGT